MSVRSKGFVYDHRRVKFKQFRFSVLAGGGVMAEGDKQLNVDSIIQRLLEGRRAYCSA